MKGEKIRQKFPKREQQSKPKPYGVDFVENFFSWKALRSQFLRYTDLQPAVFPFPPQLFQVEGQSEQKQLGSHIGSASGQEAPESEILL